MTLCLKNPIVIISITTIILVLFYSVYMIFFSKSSTTSSPTTATTKSPTSPTTTSNIDNKKIDLALNASGISTPRKENFYTDIVFDSIEKINNNFLTMLNIYFPSIDINSINLLLKENGIDDNVQKIINDNKNTIDYESYFASDNIKVNTYLKIYAENNKTNIILAGLYFVLIMNIYSKSELSKVTLSSTDTDNRGFYYLNDYDTENDFIIYFIGGTYNGDLKMLNTDCDIKFADDIEPGAIVKFSLKNILRKYYMGEAIMRATTNTTVFDYSDPIAFSKSLSGLTNTDYEKYELVLNQNIVALNKQLNYELAIFIVSIYNKGVITKDTKILKDFITFMSNKTTFSCSYKFYHNLDYYYSEDPNKLNVLVSNSLFSYNRHLINKTDSSVTTTSQ